jgi:Tfp pilus assembly protein PilN
MKVRLNLASQPLQSNRRFLFGAGFVGCVGLLTMASLSWHAYSTWKSDQVIRGEEAQTQREMQQLDSRRADLEAFFNRPDSVRRRELSGFLNGLIAQRAFPWTKIFMDLERSLPEGVRVVSIEPKLTGDHLELQLLIGATNDDSKLKFLKTLENSGDFSQIEVLSETRADKPTELDQVKLAIVARYSAT